MKDDVAVLMKEDGATEQVKPANGKEFSLEEMYKMLDCDNLQAHPTPNPKTFMLFDEEGKFKNKEVNIQATLLVRDYLLPGDFVVGMALVCPRSMFK